MSHNNPPVRNAVIAVLRARGPLTCHQIAEAMDWPLVRVQSVLRNTRRLHPEKIFRVVRYKRVAEGNGKDLSVYALDAGPDALRHVTDMAARRLKSRALYRHRNKAAINARNRASRALQAGHAPRASPWSQLATSGGILSAITYLERTSGAE